MAKKLGADLVGAMRKSGGASKKPKQPGPNGESRIGRADKQNVTGYFAADVKLQLRYLSVERDRTIQGLLGEALNLLFAKYGKPEVAPLDE